MNLEITIIGIILSAICIVPLVIMHYNRTKKENKRLQYLNDIAIQHNCKISKHEFCGDFVIGIDESRNFVFFFKNKNEDIISQFVDLSDIKTCKVIKNTKTIKTENENVIIIERLELSFLPTNKNKLETRFEFYDNEINNQLSGELQLIDKWEEQINNLIGNKK
jgi:hypothetical protein